MASDETSREESIATLNALMHFLVACLNGRELLEMKASKEELDAASRSGDENTELTMQLDLRLGVFVVQSILSFLKETTPESTAAELKINVAGNILRNMFELSDDLTGRVMVPVMDAVADANERIRAKAGTEAEAELDEDWLVEASMLGRFIAAEFHSAYAKDRETAPTDHHCDLVQDMLGH